MCGIAGSVGLHREEARAAVSAMCGQMVARGPDADGIVEIGDTNVTMGSRRLMIIDPTPAGHQPMTDEDRRTTLVFNGMIYNFQSLRQQLISDGEMFASNCDTEVVLKAYGRWGTDCVRRLRGMFAFAIWDGRLNRLFLARDRLGIKPLFYWQNGTTFLFASQVKALLATGIVPPTLSAPGIRTFLEYGAVSDPLTGIDRIYSLPAAHTAVIQNGRLLLQRYWDFPNEADLAISRDEAVLQLRAHLEEAVAAHLISDVPLGVFLSGGIDSSTIAALASRHTNHLRTISVVFDEAMYSEERYVDVMISQLHSDHVRVPLRASDLVAWSEQAFDAMDQPTFDGINTYAVSRAARSTGLKVALSGLGGDELFDGYGQTRRVNRLEAVRRIPTPVARFFGRTLNAVDRSTRGAKARAWLAGEFDGGSPYELLRRLFLPEDVAALLGPRGGDGVAAASRTVGSSRDLYGRVSILELANYTKNVLLRDTDSMSMSQSLEVRVPFLDNVLVEWVLRLPPEVKEGRPKGLLVDAVRDLLPGDIVARPKRGFLIPIGSWMRGELRADVQATLADPPAAVADLLDSDSVAAIWGEYLAGRRSWLHPWSLYALSQWARSLSRDRLTSTL